MKKLLGMVLTVLLTGAVSASAEDEDFRPFPVDWSNVESAVDVSFLLDAPAGKDGFIGIRDGHLVYPDGGRFRVWGVNNSMAGTIPTKEHAPQIAAKLARLGVNCVRFHHMDRTSAILDANRDDTRVLDPEKVDRLDFFVSELKKRGIYINLNLNVSRTYKVGDGVRDYELVGYAKAMTYFDERLIVLQKEYAQQLLTHYNPYTQSEYRSEPAVAFVEMINENSIIESWIRSRLLGKNTRRNPGTWSDIPASYERALTEKYNDWLKNNRSSAELASLRKEAGVSGSASIPRLSPDEFENASKLRFHAESSFYMDMESGFFAMMQNYLRDEIGVKSLLVGTSDHNHGISGYPLLSSTSQIDVVDGHTYWQHPSYTRDPVTNRTTGFTIPNTPMVDDPLHSTPVQLSRSAVHGKPYTVSEVNHPFPAENSCEGIPVLAAYASLQDWDGIYWYSLAHSDPVSMDNEVPSHFDIAQDPVKMTQLAAGALMFVRGDISPAQQTVQRSYTNEQIIESIRMPNDERPFYTPGFDLAIPLHHGTRIASFNNSQTAGFMQVSGDPVKSDTGELAWYHPAENSGLVTVDTELSQALIGFLKANRQKVSNLDADVNVPFCAITLSSLDNNPIARSAKMLLTATAREANTGMQWNPTRTSLEDWGRPPICIEPVAGTVILKNLEDAEKVTAQPLDGAGQPVGQEVSGKRTANGWVIEIGNTPTTWYNISVGR